MTDEITSGIRKVVALLQLWGFDTCDSGDGITNVDAGMECALPFPNVTIMSKAVLLAEDADNLMSRLAEVGVIIEPQSVDGPSIQASYDPANGSAVILLLNVKDSLLK